MPNFLPRVTLVLQNVFLINNLPAITASAWKTWCWQAGHNASSPIFEGIFPSDSLESSECHLDWERASDLRDLSARTDLKADDRLETASGDFWLTQHCTGMTNRVCKYKYKDKYKYKHQSKLNKYYLDHWH